MKVLINPFGGTGNAQKLFTKHIEPIFRTAKCELELETTKWSGHAAQIAEEMDITSYDVIACCSGDGLPYEVFNGLAKRADASKALNKIAVVQLPCGSGNAMSLNLNGTDSPSLAALTIVKGVRTPLDLVSITQGENRMISFLSQSVGIVAEVDLGTEDIRWMGSARFTYGFLTRIFGKTVYPVDLAVKVAIETKDAIREHYQQKSHDALSKISEETEPLQDGLPPLKYGTVQDKLPEDWEMISYPNMGNFYAGNVSRMIKSLLDK
jgi:sphingosine kinase